jgi:nitrous oxide reductase accessory protein NosL
MKDTIIIGVMAATIMMAGCGKKSASSSTAPPPGSKPVALSDGSNTWYLGGMTINGTNVPATNITIRVKTPEVSK